MSQYSPVGLCFTQVRYCLKTLREQMAAKNKVCLFWAPLLCLTIVNTPNGISSTFFVSIFHSFLADFLLFSHQLHTNGWKVGVPFRKNASSAPKEEAKAAAQVNFFSCEQPLLTVVNSILRICVGLFRFGAVHVSNVPYYSCSPLCVRFLLDNVFLCVSCDAGKAIASQRHTRRCKVKQKEK